MRGRLLAFVALLLGGSSISAQSVPPKKLAASLDRVFGGDVQIDSIRIDSAMVLRVRSAGTLRGFATVRSAMGKDQPITYLVAVDSALTLLDIDILVYREAYGGEVAYESWRKQFRGRTPEDHLEVGRGIRGISGATISANAVTAGIRRTLTDLAGWRKSGIL